MRIMKNLAPQKEVQTGTYLAIRYSLEFVVVVLGISVSFWLNEWNELRNELEHQTKDTIDLVDDLTVDGERLDVVSNAIEVGKNRTSRILKNHLDLQQGISSYDAFADSLIDIGYAYSFLTFFMVDGTYKSLINNGRLQNFPSDLEKDIKGYYEYVSKRVEDNNEIVDNVALEYYAKHHPMCLWVEPFVEEEGDAPGAVRRPKESLRSYLLSKEVRVGYESVEFFNATLVLRDRAFVHGGQIKRYEAMRNTLTHRLQDSLEGLATNL
jgi:hypothetical protein